MRVSWMASASLVPRTSRALRATLAPGLPRRCGRINKSTTCVCCERRRRPTRRTAALRALLRPGLLAPRAPRPPLPHHRLAFMGAAPTLEATPPLVPVRLVRAELVAPRRQQMHRQRRWRRRRCWRGRTPSPQWGSALAEPPVGGLQWLAAAWAPHQVPSTRGCLLSGPLLAHRARLDRLPRQVQPQLPP